MGEKINSPPYYVICPLFYQIRNHKEETAKRLCEAVSFYN